MLSYSFMGLDADNKYQDVALFKVVFEKSVHCLGMALDENNETTTFRFKTYSPYINWTLPKAIEQDKK